MVLMLGFVSISNMQTNLLPDVNTPYLMVVTVYPGASPERVESEVSDVMQNALGTVAGVEKVTATSAENYSLLLMQFSDDTDMNSAMVKVSNKVDQTTASLPSSCLTPSIIEYSLNMNAFMTAAVSREGSDVYDLSEFVSDTLVPYVERKGGPAQPGEDRRHQRKAAGSDRRPAGRCAQAAGERRGSDRSGPQGIRPPVQKLQ